MTAAENRTYDVIVVGSGASGSIAVKELTERGLEVLLLEAGRDLREDDFVPSPKKKVKAMGIGLTARAQGALSGYPTQMRRAFYNADVNRFLVNDWENPYTSVGTEYLWIRGRVLGGRLHTYGKVLMRASDHEFKAASLDGNGIDWPISYSELEKWYDRVEEFTGLYGTSDGISNLPDGKYVGEAKLNSAEQHLKATVEARWPERKVISWRYQAPNLGRVPKGIAAARDTGRLTVRTDAVVTRITTDPSTGLATGAVFVDRLTRQEHTVRADVVVMCASTIETIRIMQNSGGGKHPDGLANSSGTLGRYFMDQTPGLLFGSHPDYPGSEVPIVAPSDPFYAPTGGVYVPRWQNLHGVTDPEFARGWGMQGAMCRMPVPEGTPGSVGFMSFDEMLPDRENRVSLHPWRKDRWAMPIPRIHLKLGANELALQASQVAGMREMAEEAGVKVNFAGNSLGLDSSKVWPDADPISRTAFRMFFRKSLAVGAAIHECGGARMGADPATSVLNGHNQAWDIPNLFVTDSASYTSNGATGPTLTIMALSARAAEFIAKEHASGNLHKVKSARG